MVRLTTAGVLFLAGLVGMHLLVTTLEQCSRARVSTFAPGSDAVRHSRFILAARACPAHRSLSTYSSACATLRARQAVCMARKCCTTRAWACVASMHQLPLRTCFVQLVTYSMSTCPCMENPTPRSLGCWSSTRTRHYAHDTQVSVARTTHHDHYSPRCYSQKPRPAPNTLR
jgi:hypothetical protein